MDIHIPASIGLILLGLSLVALLFIGYQLDDLYRRIKEIESLGTHDIKDIIREVSKEVNVLLKNAEIELNTCFNRRIDSKMIPFVQLIKRISDLEEQIKPKPKGKVGRPKKVISGKDKS